MAKTNNEIEHKVNYNAIQIISNLTSCSACKAPRHHSCNNQKPLNAGFEYLTESVHQIRLLDFKDGFESISKAFDIFEQTNSPYIRSTNDKPTEKIGKIRI